VNPDSLSKACPYLGCRHDPDSHFAYPHAANYCYAQERAKPVELTFQSETCLSGSWTHCPRYSNPVRSQRIAPPSLVAAAQARRSRERKIALSIGGGLLALIALIAAALWYYWPFPGPAPSAAPAARAVPSASPTVRPTYTDTPLPTASAIPVPPTATQIPAPASPVTATLLLTITPFLPPTPTVAAAHPVSATPTVAPTVTPTAIPTETPTAAPAAALPWSTVHVVQPGDFVARIARRYGATVADIVSANKLDDPGIVYRGQILLVPLSSAQKALAATPALTGSRETGPGALPLPAPVPSSEPEPAPDGTITLTWQSEQPLEPGDYFALYLWWEEQRTPCFLTLLTEPTYTLDLTGRAAGTYRWAVQIVEGRRDGPLQILHRPRSPLGGRVPFKWQTR